MSQANRTVLIIGMHRSGTSLLAEALHACGFSIADELIPDISDVNSRGFWEDKQVVDTNEKLFEILESDWFDIRELPDGWLQDVAVQEQLVLASEYVGRQYGENALSVLKDPRISRLLPFWQEVFKRNSIDLACLIMVRSPSAVAESLKARNGLPSSYGNLLWCRYLDDALRDSAGLNRTTVDYDCLLDSPFETLKTTLDNLGIGGLEPPDEIQTIADKTMRHHLHESVKNSSSLSQDFYAALTGEEPELDFRVEVPVDKETTEMLYGFAKAMVHAYSEQVRIGELHSSALETVELRDQQLKELEQYYLNVVAAKDQEIQKLADELQTLVDQLNVSFIGKQALRQAVKKREQKADKQDN